ncbi:DUF4428 domain-containing protein [Vallitalea pronyensis]|uniref:DUF4428 domain-containing protein n=1 Tax=Vallitalea pronyensis TaxID=1348613 RepID=A0A8J8MQH6_9FIRM|nr:DUF4428 domain-containing protein [Vallitalea pronyensis]QUI25839.1 DUF4428 domain-containing protein [Vallitalea pronyensis]
MATYCAICNKKAGILGRKQIRDGYICTDCFYKCKLDMDMSCFSVNDIKDRYRYIEENREPFKNFIPTIKIARLFEVDENSKLFRTRKGAECFKFSDIVNFELYEDGDAVIKGGMGKAVTGGLLLGGVGAIVGGVTGKRKQKSVVSNMYIRISLNHRWVKNIRINLIQTQLKRSGFLYKEVKKSCDNIISVLETITNKQRGEEVAVTGTVSVADEILKFKELLDMGAITQDEFDKKKKQLLEQ